MAGAERERKELGERIQDLEVEKKELQTQNSLTIAENRDLLDQLEVLNGCVSESESRIKALEAALQSSNQAVRRLEGATSRAEDMERHITVLEQEQAMLQSSLSLSESETRCAIQRWKKAERDLDTIQEQLDRMEKEAQEERERHAEVLTRLHRQRMVEQELNIAAQRLKTAATAKTMPLTGNNGVINHFVRDLLHDNAELQLSIAELREMLHFSTEEIQGLREQLQSHQPIEPFSPRTLDVELSSSSVNQELHIHHHYHPAKPDARRKGKRRATRQSLSQTLFAPLIAETTPSPPTASSSRQLLAYVTPLSKGHRSRESISSKARWSILSDQKDTILSSLPSSPQSNHHHSALFDPGYIDDIPESPVTSIDSTSPTMTATHRKQSIDMVFSPLSQIRPNIASPKQERRKSLSIHIEQAGEVEYDIQTALTDTNGSSTVVSSVSNDDNHEESGRIPIHGPIKFVPAMQEATIRASSFNPPSTTLPIDEKRHSHWASQSLSYESIKSVGGMDIHTLSSRPSQLSLRPLGAAMPTITSVTAEATIPRGYGAAILRSRIATHQNNGWTPKTRVKSSNITSNSARTSSNLVSESTTSSTGVIGKITSWRPWANGNMGRSSVQESAFTALRPPMVEEEREAETQTIQSLQSTVSFDTQKAHLNTSFSSSLFPSKSKENGNKNTSGIWRGPGINQPGAIPGFQQYLAYHSRKSAVHYKVVPERVDLEGLQDVLGE